MTVKEIVLLIDDLPSGFTIDGVHYKINTAKMDNDEYLAIVWEMSGTKRVAIHSYAIGITIVAAKENLKALIIK